MEKGSMTKGTTGMSNDGMSKQGMSQRAAKDGMKNGLHAQRRHEEGRNVQVSPSSSRSCDQPRCLARQRGFDLV